VQPRAAWYGAGDRGVAALHFGNYGGLPAKIIWALSISSRSGAGQRLYLWPDPPASPMEGAIRAYERGAARAGAAR